MSIGDWAVPVWHAGSGQVSGPRLELKKLGSYNPKGFESEHFVSSAS